MNLAELVLPKATRTADQSRQGREVRVSNLELGVVATAHSLGCTSAAEASQDVEQPGLTPTGGAILPERTPMASPILRSSASPLHFCHQSDFSAARTSGSAVRPTTRRILPRAPAAGGAQHHACTVAEVLSQWPWLHPLDSPREEQQMTRANRKQALCHRRFQCQVLHAVLNRRDEQDHVFGGPANDNTHSLEDWLALISIYTAQADARRGEVSMFIDKLLDVVALAAAAIEGTQRTQTPEVPFENHRAQPMESL